MIELYEFGYAGLFVASFLAATVLPFSSEALLLLMVSTKYGSFLSILIASTGNWLGGMSCYYLGFAGKWKWIEKYLKIKKNKVEKLRDKISNKGAAIGFFCWLPFIGDFIAVALGLLKINIYKVSITMFAGKLLRYIILVYFVLLF